MTQLPLPRYDLEWALSSTRFRGHTNERPVLGRSFVVYYRVSTPKQGRSGLGLAGQRTAVERFVARWRGAVVAEYTEILSGKKPDRKQLQTALGACRVYGATLLVAELDRLTRSAAFIAMLIETRADFILADFPLASTFEKHILASIAENELKQMSDRRKAVCGVLKARGVSVAARLQGKRVRRPEDLDAAHAEVRRRALSRAAALAPLLCELRDSGKSINAIADELMRLEIEPPRGGARWSWSTIRQLFRRIGEEPPRLRRAGCSPKKNDEAQARASA